jgi:hypothetical protein
MSKFPYGYLREEGVVATELAPPLLKPSHRPHSYEFFVSSGSDLREQREQFRELVREFHSQFKGLGLPDGSRLALDVEMWEHDASHVYPDPKDPMARYVAMAVSAHCTVALLGDEVRPGTRKEIEAVLSAGVTQLRVLVMPGKGREPSAEVKEFLDQHREIFYNNSEAAPGDFKSTAAMVRLIASTVCDILTQTYRQEVSIENRP